MKNYALVFSLLLMCMATHGVKAQSTAHGESKKLIDQLVGTWTLNKIYEGKKTLATTGQPEAMNKITFTREAKYIATTQSSTYDSGFLKTNEGEMTLYLESVSDHTPREWNVKVEGSILELWKKEPSNIRKYRYVYVRDALNDASAKKLR
jgi:hypothetical protein